MLFLVLLLAVSFANPTADRPKAAPAKAAAEMLASWNARLRALWQKNEGIGVREERITLRVWSEKDRGFNKPIEQVDARRIDRRSGGTTFVLSGRHVKTGRPPAGSEVIDKDGTVWVVGAVEPTNRDYSCAVRKKMSGFAAPVAV